MIDNFSTSHGRQPTYDRNRKIVVAWADPLAKSNEVQSLVIGETGTASRATSRERHEHGMENPQERTPESTLTHSESQILQAMSKQVFLASSHSSFAAASGSSSNIDTASDNPQQEKPSQHSSNKPSVVADGNFWEEME